MLSAFIECSNGILTENGCGGINFISSETGSFPPSLTLRTHLYSTQSLARGTTPRIFSFDSNIILYLGISIMVYMSPTFSQITFAFTRSSGARRGWDIWKGIDCQLCRPDTHALKSFRRSKDFFCRTRINESELNKGGQIYS